MASNELITCVFGCCTKISLNSYVEHLIQNHNALIVDINIKFAWRIGITKNSDSKVWSSLQVFDGKTFIWRFLLRGNIFHAQMFLLGSASDAEKYLCEFKLSGTGMKQKIIFCGDVVPIHFLNTENVEQHPGTLRFNDSTARTFLKHGDDESYRIKFNLSIMKKD